jgi:DMSO reductase anchor subunit
MSLIYGHETVTFIFVVIVTYTCFFFTVLVMGLKLINAYLMSMRPFTYACQAFSTFAIIHDTQTPNMYVKVAGRYVIW